MVRTGSARWQGTLKEGKGSVSTGSGALKEVPYDFRKRFENDPGTNPEELIGAAHAACFSMAFSATVAGAGKTLDSVDTKANVTLQPSDGGFAVTKVHLDVVARIPGATADDVQRLAETTKNTCPISKLLKAEITVTAKLA